MEHMNSEGIKFSPVSFAGVEECYIRVIFLGARLNRVLENLLLMERDRVGLC